MNRVADNSLAKRLLGWEPQIKFMTGLGSTIDWYFSTKDRKKVASELETLLTERQSAIGEGSHAAGSDATSATVSA
jgi:dTDP-D-glucose 4,6-dehydratase